MTEPSKPYANADLRCLIDELRGHIIRKTGKPIDPDVDFLMTQIELISASGPVAFNMREELVLTPKQRRLLNHLAARPGRIFSRDALMNALYFDDLLGELPGPRIIDVYILRIRTQLLAADSPYWIESVWGEGFRYVNKPARREMNKTSNGQPRRIGGQFMKVA